MARVTITEAELLEALGSAHITAPDDALTMAEWKAEMPSVGEKRLRAALLALKRTGRLGIHRVQRESLDGRAISVQAYTILPKKKAAR